MNLVQITPGAGKMYCGNCFRDNALVAELRRKGHTALMVPLYLPLTLDEEDQSRGVPVFFGGVNVYLEQQSASFRRWAPGWLRHLLSAPTLLRWAAGRAAKTRAEDVGEMTLSMLRGEDGNQARDLDELVAWLEAHPHPDGVCLSNALLLGMARQLRRHLRAPVICMLQGEDAFLDALPAGVREQAWTILAERAQDADCFVTPSHYFAERMTKRLGLRADRVQVVPNGISLEGYRQKAPVFEGRSEQPEQPPFIGYFARMSADKGLDVLVDAFIALRSTGRSGNVRLRIGGGCGPADEPFVAGLQRRLRQAGLEEEVEWVKNPDRQGKVALLQSLSLFSVPARCGEAFGLYVIEALAAGVPVVLPRAGAFPELVEQTGGGVLCKPEDVGSLATQLEELLRDDSRRRQLAEVGCRAVHARFGVSTMADNLLGVFGQVAQRYAAS